MRNVRHVTLIIRSLQALIILRQYDFRTGQFLRRIRTEVHHHLFDFVSSRLARLHDINRMVERETVLHVNIHQDIEQRLPLVFGPSTDLCQERTSGHSILVAHEVFGQESV